jgi:hypothetical protein
VLQEYVLQEYVLENPTICEREVGCSPVIREVEFVFSGVERERLEGNQGRFCEAGSLPYSCTW